MRRILCLHLPYFLTERVRRDVAQASDRQQPLALTRPVGSSLVLEQVCPHARQLGLRPGLSLSQAQALAPKLVVFSHEPQRDRAALERLAGWALRFSPIVESVAPDTLLVDIAGCQLLFGGEENIARQAVAGLTRQGFYARAAIADTIGAAWAMATAGAEPLTIVPVGQASAYLTPLPPAALRIEPHVNEKLEALGIRSIGDLLRLPRAALPARFGSQLVLRLQQALGEVFEGVTPHQPEEVPVAGRRFEVPVADWQVIVSAAEQLLVDVFTQALQRESALRRLECVLYYENAAPRVVSIGLARASRQQQHVAKLLTQRLEQIDLTPGIVGLRLVARETSRFHGRQGDLFEPREPGDDEALGCLIDRLAGRLGYEAVMRPRLVDDHQPEMAFRYVSVAEAGCKPDESVTVGWALPTIANAGTEKMVGDAHPTRPPARPVRLLARPMPIRVIALVPDGPPTWFSYRGQEYVVARAHGPERLETAWWRGPDIRRDYFRVSVESGEQFWIFHAADERRWYLHGFFI